MFMRYLKMYESVDSFIEGLEDFCEANFVWLMDDNPKGVLNYSVTKADNHLAFIKLKYNPPLYWLPEGRVRGEDTIVWDDIKDYIIPFFARLKKNYTIVACSKLPNNLSKYIVKSPLNTTDYGDVLFYVTNPSWINYESRRLISKNIIGGKINYWVDDVILDNVTEIDGHYIVEICFYVSDIDYGNEPKTKKDGFGKRIKRFLGI